MGCTVTPAPPHRSSDDYRRSDFACIHVVELRCVIDDLICAQSKKIAEHDFHHGPTPGKSQTGANPHEGCLAYRRVPDAPRKQLTEVLRDLESSAIRTLDILTEADNPFVSFHVPVE